MVENFVRALKHGLVWTSVAIGTCLNAVLILLIVRHTPATMKVYSKILLQTCVTDLLLLIVTLLTDRVGGPKHQVWLNGLVQISDPHYRVWGFSLYLAWIFLIFAILFGFLGQFIYRYLVLNRNLYVPISHYFLLLAVLFVFPLVHGVLTTLVSYPIDGHEFLTDPFLANAMGLDIGNGSAPIVIVSNTVPGTASLTIADFYYLFAVCTVAVVAMLVLGVRMHRFVKNQIHNCSFLSIQKRTMEKQRRLTAVLCIQAFLSASVYVPILTSLMILLFDVTLDPSNVYYLYFNVFNNILMCVAAAVNPAVTIMLIGNYRRALQKRLQKYSPK